MNNNGEDIPLRTFHNHRKAIELMFDINIECDKRNGYVYYIENSEDMERSGVRQWLINTFAVNNLINESHKLKHRILFEKIPSGQRLLTSIIEAMRDSATLEMTYQSYHRGYPSTFQLEPYCVKVFKQLWYVVGRSVYEDKVRIYSLDRIVDMQSVEIKFTLPNDFDAELYFENCYGVITTDGNTVETVDIKVYGMQVNYLKALPIHNSQQEVKSNNEYTIFRYHIKPTYDFQQELLSHGADIEVISPQWFRKEIRKIVEKQCDIYSK